MTGSMSLRAKYQMSYHMISRGLDWMRGEIEGRFVGPGRSMIRTLSIQWRVLHGVWAGDRLPSRISRMSLWNFWLHSFFVPFSATMLSESLFRLSPNFYCRPEAPSLSNKQPQHQEYFPPIHQGC